MEKRAAGRPLGSDIRDHIVEILFIRKCGYAYELAKIHNDIYRKVTPRTIYYHLTRGLLTEEFVIQEIREEIGEFSWGKSVEKIYYALGPSAKPQGDVQVKEYMDKNGLLAQ